MHTSVDAARREISALLADSPPGALLADEALRALGRVVGHDGYCLFGVDPTTGLRSVMFSRHGLTVPTDVLLHNETVERDANRYSDLAHAPFTAGTLTAVGTPRSPRLHEILPLDGYSSELRLALTTPGRYWGALSMFRGDAHRPFSDQDVEAAYELAPSLAAVVRKYEVGRPRDAWPARPLAGGVICLDSSGAVVGIDDQAGKWLGSLANGWEQGAVTEDVLRCVHEVAAAARRRAAGGPCDGPAPESLTRTRIADGRWMVASGTYVGGSEVDVVVTTRSGDVGTVLPAFALWCGLSERETGVLQLLVQGLAAKQVARRLGISVLTVGDHQRSLYRKAGVRGRDELVSLLL